MCVRLPFSVHVPLRLTWAYSERRFCLFPADRLWQVPVQSMYVNMAHLVSLVWGASFHLCVCVCLAVQPCFMVASCSVAEAPFVFLSGCWLLSRLCSSCCSKLSSAGNFWSCWSAFSLWLMQLVYFIHTHTYRLWMWNLCSAMLLDWLGCIRLF